MESECDVTFAGVIAISHDFINDILVNATAEF